MRQSSITHPLSIVPRFDARTQTFFVTRSIAIHSGPKFIPINLAIVVVLTFFIPLQIRIGQSHTQDLGLRHSGVDKLLTQVIVADALDAPAHALHAVRTVGIGRPKHGQAFPPPAVDRVLHHGLLFGRALHHHQQSFVALSLMETLFFANANHGARIRTV